mgnify:FL=1
MATPKDFIFQFHKGTIKALLALAQQQGMNIISIP